MQNNIPYFVLSLLNMYFPTDSSAAPWYSVREPIHDLLRAHEIWEFRNRSPKQYQSPYIYRNSATGTIPHGAGLLERLPLEIAHEILLDLDLDSLNTLRLASHTCRIIIDSFPMMDRLVSNTPKTLEALKVADVSSKFSLRTIYAEFCYPWCRFCGAFGPLLFLPTFSRSCRECHDKKVELQVAPIKTAAAFFGLAESELDGIPYTDTISGPFDPIDPPEQRIRLVRLVDAFQRAQEVFGQGPWSRAEMRALVSQSALPIYPRNWRYMGSLTFPYWNRRTRQSENGSYCKACLGFFKCIPRSVRSGHRAAYWYTWRAESRRAYLEEEKNGHLEDCPAYRQGYLAMVSHTSLPGRPSQRTPPLPRELTPSPVEIPSTRRKKIKAFFRKFLAMFRRRRRRQV